MTRSRQILKKNANFKKFSAPFEKMKIFVDMYYPLDGLANDTS